jgi:hypothetical protein
MSVGSDECLGLFTDQHERWCRPAARDVGRGQHERAHDDAVDGREALAGHHLQLGTTIAVALRDEDSDAARLCDADELRGELGEVRFAQVRENECDETTPATAELTGSEVGAVPQLVDRVEDALLHRFADPSGSVHDVGDRLCAHPDASGDVRECDSCHPSSFFQPSISSQGQPVLDEPHG